MDISTKVLSWGVGGAVFGALALLSFQSVLILPYLDEMETRIALDKASQVQSLFRSEAEAFSLTNEDWAYWDSAADFVRGENSEFAAENLYPAAFESIRTDAMLFFRTDGSVYWARQLSRDRRSLVAVEDLTVFLQTLTELGPKRAGEGTEGYLQTPSGLVMVSERQIRPSQQPGGPEGTLMLVRKLEPSFWASFQSRMGLDLVPEAPGASVSPLPTATASADRSVTTLRVPMADLLGEVRLQLRAELPRTLTTTGLGLLVQVSWGSITILVLISVANGLLIRLFLVRPVKELWRLTRQVEASGDWSLRAVARSRDEIGELAEGVNALIESVQQTTGRLQELASTDPLTGLANRRTFDLTLEQSWKACSRNEEPLSVIMVDVDRFKEFNDHHGHQGGDACLKVVAQMIRDVAARPSDVKARYGGEEFALILPDTDLAGARIVAERIRAAVEDLRIVTVSLGCASQVPQAGMSAHALVEEADRQLYQAKADGRNLVRG